MRDPQLHALVLSRIATLALVLGLVSCSANDEPEQSNDTMSSQSSSPPAEPDDASFTITPGDPQPGQSFAANFDPANQRGGFFLLSRWDGEQWADPEFLLESDANQGPPIAGARTDDGGTLDYGVEGPGPDNLVLPDQLDVGTWRLCTANALDNVCTQFTVR